MGKNEKKNCQESFMSEQKTYGRRNQHAQHCLSERKTGKDVLCHEEPSQNDIFVAIDENPIQT